MDKMAQLKPKAATLGTTILIATQRTQTLKSGLEIIEGRRIYNKALISIN
jgi:hypothetical protein